jgi:hypothetical protein
MNNTNCPQIDDDVHPYASTDLDSITKQLTKYNNKCKFSSLTINICSMRKNLNLLLLFLSKVNFNFDFIILNEIWLSPDIDVDLDIPGYCGFKLYRNSHSGGVAIFVLQKYSTHIISEFTILHNCFESLFINVSISKHFQLCLGTIYRPPSSNLNDFNDNLRDLFLSKIKSSNIIITGDFNVNLLEKTPPLSHRNFCNLFAEYNFTQICQSATRVTDHSLSLIDHTWTTLPISLFSSTIEFKLSDHFPICSIFPLDIEPCCKLISLRSYSDVAINGFCQAFDDLYNIIMDRKFILS